MSRENLQEQFEDFAKSLVKPQKKSFEEIFQATLDATTPDTPGDLRSTRKWPTEDESESEWV
jgi:hypothetical protein